MTTETDPLLEALFARATEAMAPDDFADRVMLKIDRARRRQIAGWAVVAFAAIACAWIVSDPLLRAVNLGMQVFPESLFEFEDQIVAQVFAPLNSIGGALGLGVLGIWAGYRKIFR